MSRRERPAPPSTARVARLMLGLAWRRILNRWRSNMRVAGTQKLSVDKTAIARRKPVTALALVGFGVLLLFWAAMMSGMAWRVATNFWGGVAVEATTYLPDSGGPIVLRHADPENVERLVEAAERYKESPGPRTSTDLRRYALFVAAREGRVPEDGPEPPFDFDIDSGHGPGSGGSFGSSSGTTDEPVLISIDTESAYVDLLIETATRRGRSGFRYLDTRFGLPTDPRTIPLSGDGRATVVLAAVAFTALVAFAILCMTLVPLRGRFGRADWELPWLFGFPVTARTIFASRVVRQLGSLWLVTLPLAVLLATFSYGAGAEIWSALGVGAALAFGALLLVSVLQTVLEQRLVAGATRKRAERVVGAATLLGGIVAVWGFGMTARPLVPDVFVHALSFTASTSVGSVIAAAAGTALVSPLVAVGVSIVLVAGAFAGALVVVERTASGGLARSLGGGHEGHAGVDRTAHGIGMVGKELRAIRRDRQVATMLFVLPIVLLGVQVVQHASFGVMPDFTFAQVCAAAFGFGGYSTVLASNAIAQSERSGIALLSTFPVPLTRLFMRKVATWSVAVLLFPALIVVAAPFLATPSNPVGGLVLAVLALGGVVAFGMTAGAVAMLELGRVEPGRMRAAMSRLFLLALMAVFAASIAQGQVWNAVVQTVVLGAIAAAMWQRVELRAPQLLDPTSEPEPTVLAVDGLVAVLVFFQVQVVVATMVRLSDGSPDLGALLGFVFGGLAAVATLVGTFWSRGVFDLVSRLALARTSAGTIRDAAFGARAGLACAALGVAYLLVAERFEAYRELRAGTPDLLSCGNGTSVVAVALLAILAAPLFEELIFRGAVQRGFRSTMGSRAAILLSAALFAACHPLVSALPVFVLGLAAGWVLERRGSLWASIACHATYNAIVVGFTLAVN
ncbi:MAG: CPBP family intramembrane glutamic endopeptidase [Planctomycetota bacterium]